MTIEILCVIQTTNNVLSKLQISPLNEKSPSLLSWLNEKTQSLTLCEVHHHHVWLNPLPLLLFSFHSFFIVIFRECDACSFFFIYYFKKRSKSIIRVSPCFLSLSLFSWCFIWWKRQPLTSFLSTSSAPVTSLDFRSVSYHSRQGEECVVLSEGCVRIFSR